MTATRSSAFLAQGKLFVKHGDQPAKEIESKFAQEIIERDTRDRQRHGWKQSSNGWMATSRGEMPWMTGQTGDPEARRIHITSVARVAAVDAAHMLYTLDTDTVGGLFHYDTLEAYERRLVHHSEFRIRDLDRHPDDGEIACSVRHKDGTASVAVMPADGGKLREITEGDSVDESPAWVTGRERKLVFQTAGIGRDHAGIPLGLGPYRIEMLDFERNDMRVVMEDAQRDLLQPRMLADGTLYFIRRPWYLHGHAPVSPLRRIGDVLLYPFRLMLALHAFLNFMSMTFRGKGLTAAGGPKREGPDMRFMMLHGRMIDVKKAESALSKQGGAGLFPRDWELVKVDATGAEQTLARGVGSYDLTPQGTVLYSDGKAVFEVNDAGKADVICRQAMIERVIALR